MSVAIYPGSFDPITLGHINVLSRAANVFEKVIIAVADNEKKTGFIPVDKRIELIQQSIHPYSNVFVESFYGLTVTFAKQQSAQVIIRGLRAISDFEFEFKMAQMNKKLDSSIETIFMMADLEYQFLSSSLVKEVSRFNGDISSVVPQPVIDYLAAHPQSNV